MDTEYRLFKENQIAGLAKIEHICLTADLWSRSRRAFLGVTAHWIDNETLKRKSYALACKRMPGAHTAEVVTKGLFDVMDDYKIKETKVTRIVTDGGSNFSKAFKDAEKARKQCAENNINNPSTSSGAANVVDQGSASDTDDAGHSDDNGDDELNTLIDEGHDDQEASEILNDMGGLLCRNLCFTTPVDSDGEDEDLDNSKEFFQQTRIVLPIVSV